MDATGACGGGEGDTEVREGIMQLPSFSVGLRGVYWLYETIVESDCLQA
jgi:hypothetical protein